MENHHIRSQQTRVLIPAHTSYLFVFQQGTDPMYSSVSLCKIEGLTLHTSKVPSTLTQELFLFLCPLAVILCCPQTALYWFILPLAHPIHPLHYRTTENKFYPS